MTYTLRNGLPSVLFIPDAGLRLEAGQTTVVTALTPQMVSLLATHVLEVVTPAAPSSAPVVTPPAEAVTVNPPVEAKRSGRKTTEPLVISEPHDDAQ